MTSDEAETRIKRMVDFTEEPTLTQDDIDDLVDVAARADADGLYRDDAEWTPTWDLNAAAAEGWLRKAGRAATKFNFAEDGQRFDRAQIYQHCMSQHTLYANKGMGVIS